MYSTDWYDQDEKSNCALNLSLFVTFVFGGMSGFGKQLLPCCWWFHIRIKLSFAMGLQMILVCNWETIFGLYSPVLLPESLKLYIVFKMSNTNFISIYFILFFTNYLMYLVLCIFMYNLRTTYMKLESLHWIELCTWIN